MHDTTPHTPFCSPRINHNQSTNKQSIPKPSQSPSSPKGSSAPPALSLGSSLSSRSLRQKTTRRRVRGLCVCWCVCVCHWRATPLDRARLGPKVVVLYACISITKIHAAAASASTTLKHITSPSHHTRRVRRQPCHARRRRGARALVGIWHGTDGLLLGRSLTAAAAAAAAARSTNQTGGSCIAGAAVRRDCPLEEDGERGGGGAGERAAPAVAVAAAGARGGDDQRRWGALYDHTVRSAEYGGIGVSGGAWVFGPAPVGGWRLTDKVCVCVCVTGRG
jgi:hypothetical protein